MRPVINELFAIADKGKVSEITRNWTYEIWQEARFKAQIHGIAPLLYCSYSDNGVLNFLDKSFTDYLSGQYLLNRTRIQRIQKVLHSILMESNVCGVIVMPLKGSLLINEYYKNPAIRPMADIDILISEDDETRMGEIMESIGYHLELDIPRHRVYISNTIISSMIGEHPDNPLAIEVHTKICCSIGFDSYDITRHIRENAEPGFLGFKHAIKPSRSMLLMHLFIHAAHHQYGGSLRAIQLYDLSKIAELIDINEWTMILSIIESLECEKLIYVVIAIAGDFMPIPVPDFVLNSLREKTPKKLRDMVKAFSLDDYIAANELRTVTILSQNLKNTFHKKVLLLTNLIISKVFISITHLKWNNSGMRGTHTILQRLKPPLPSIEQWGYFIGYSWNFILLFLAVISNLYRVQRLREEKISQLKLFIFKNSRGGQPELLKK